MILVDSSVWIDLFRGTDTPQVRFLENRLGLDAFLVGDLVAMEVLQGVQNEREAKAVKAEFDRFAQIAISDYALALEAAKHRRFLRGKGATVRKTIDCLIATRCIEDNLVLLHADRDFEPYERYLGLKSALTEHRK
ncbi:MAG: PIN domain nuclease [Pseudoxanthomonas sp.]